MNITDEMVKAFVESYDEDCCNDSAADFCCTRAGLAKVAPLIAAQALRSVDVDRIAQAIGDPGSIVGRKLGPSWSKGRPGYAETEETVTRWSTRAVLAVLAGEPDRCCARPNMVWEHSRAGKDHFRCVGCGGGMTKPRATDV